MEFPSENWRKKATFVTLSEKLLLTLFYIENQDLVK